MKTLPAFCALVLFGVASALSPPSVRGTTVVAPTFDDLVAKADCVVTADVIALRSDWTGEGEKRHIVTFVTLNVLRTLKGEVASPLTLRVFGGTIGTDRMEVADAPTFRVGERQILFVRNNGRQFIPLVRIMEYCFLSSQPNGCGGPSPRAWGIQPDARQHDAQPRAIPTGVGNTFDFFFHLGVNAGHPHGRGEYPDQQGELLGRRGPSPRAWGIPAAVRQMDL